MGIAYVLATLADGLAIQQSQSSISRILDAERRLEAPLLDGNRRRTQVSNARSLGLTCRIGPLALGRMSKSKIAVGICTATQALGISTTLLT